MFKSKISKSFKKDVEKARRQKKDFLNVWGHTQNFLGEHDKFFDFIEGADV